MLCHRQQAAGCVQSLVGFIIVIGSLIGFASSLWVTDSLGDRVRGRNSDIASSNRMKEVDVLSFSH